MEDFSVKKAYDAVIMNPDFQNLSIEQMYVVRNKLSTFIDERKMARIRERNEKYRQMMSGENDKYPIYY